MPDVYIEDVIAPNYDKLLDDVLDIGNRMGMRGGTHTGFIREEASGNTVTHGFPHGNTGCCTKYGVRTECTDKDRSNR